MINMKKTILVKIYPDSLSKKEQYRVETYDNKFIAILTKEELINKKKNKEITFNEESLILN